MAKRGKKSNKAGLLCFLLIILVCLSAYFVYSYKDSNKDKLNGNKIEEKKENKKNNTEKKNDSSNKTDNVLSNDESTSNSGSDSSSSSNSSNETKTVTVESGTSDKSKEIKYDQYIVAKGFAGASDNVYYTKDKTLYHLVISTNTTEKLATGVESLEQGLDGATAYTNSSFQKFKDDTYITYVSR